MKLIGVKQPVLRKKGGGIMKRVLILLIPMLLIWGGGAYLLALRTPSDMWRMITGALLFLIGGVVASGITWLYFALCNFVEEGTREMDEMSTNELRREVKWKSTM